MSSHSHHGVNFMKMKPGILGNRILEKQKERFSMHCNYKKTSKSRQIFSLEKSDNSSPHPTIVACYCHACAQFEFWLFKKAVKPPAKEKLILR